jgi:hypothetical protein
MRAYLIDEVSSADMKNVAEYLERSAIRSGLENLYWVPMPDGTTGDGEWALQNKSELVFAVELGPHWIKFEFFLRDLKDLRSHSAGYCNSRQRAYIVDYAHRLIEALGVKT